MANRIIDQAVFDQARTRRSSLSLVGANYTQALPTQRLVAISNRVSLRHQAAGGGLAVALSHAFKRHGGLWFGWSGEISEAKRQKPKLTENGSTVYATINLKALDYENYYKGFANRLLWPLCHDRLDLTHFNREYYASYVAVNRQFANGVFPLLRNDDLVWIHDYHLLMVGQELRRLGAKQRLGFFLHIPFPPPENLQTLPPHRELVEAMFAHDIIGFQTDGDVRAFCTYVLRYAGGEALSGGRLRAFGRTVTVKAFPIGIDAVEFARIANDVETRPIIERLTRSLNGSKLIIGVDRLDYSKGLVERLSAFDHFLEKYSRHRYRTTLLQISPHSRSDVPEYVQLRAALESRVGEICGKFGDFDWQPVRYVNQPFAPQQLAALYRHAQIGLVTPFRDGMNLVAKEYVAAQSPVDPGVLILSQFAGAARQLDAALLVNPHDTAAIADALDKALRMSRGERIERWAAMMAVLRHDDLDQWWTNFVNTLACHPREDTILLPRKVAAIGRHPQALPALRRAE